MRRTLTEAARPANPPPQIGNASRCTHRALFSWLFARRHTGKFILRLDDTDRARAEAVRDRLASGIDGPLWLAVRGNLGMLADAAIWRDVVRGSIMPVIEDAGFLAKAAAKVPVLKWRGSCR